jgi:hypothetical protein
MRPAKFAIAWVICSLMHGASTLAQAPAGALEDGFRNPPDSAKPRTWWHWTNGNVTKEGITKDLEWMKRVGIGGMHLADVASGSGQTVEKKILFGSPEWFDAVRHAASEADRLGLEMTIFSSAGWSETGGPWVKPSQAMKKLVWSETAAEGPQKFEGKLPQPPSNIGQIRNLGRGGGRGSPDAFYGDSAVIAFRTPADETSMADLKPKATTSSGAIDGAPLMDDDLNSALTVNRPAGGGEAFVQYEFAEPFTARAVTIAGPGRGIPIGRILASDDGTHFRPLVELPGAEQYRAGTVRTIAFPETTAKFYRVEMTGIPLDPAAVMRQGAPQAAASYALSEFILHSAARVNRWEEKAGFNFFYQYEGSPTPPVSRSSTIDTADVLDLTSKMAPDGSLSWDVPAGRWTILRMGYSLTGARNRPAPPTGSGLEVDKLSREYVEDYYHGYFDPLADALGPLFGKSLRYVMMDSWEAGMQNWTDEILTEFQTRRGYDPRPYLPVLAGRVVGSADVSDRFLWDFRRALADMFADNHYGTLAKLLKERGVGIYAEAAGVSMEIMEDTLLNKSKVDIPMGEFWVRALHPELQYYVDVRGAASAAHAYGKTIVGTESFTGGGYEAPFTLKKIADYWFAQGVNRIVFHTSAHQPLDTKPGNTMVGTHINRNITWADEAEPFMMYLARTSYMLQQGLFVADLAYLLPEGPPTSQPFWGAGLQPAPPEGFDYDCINADVLVNRMSVGEDGRLLLPDGMSYRVLVLPQIDEMTPGVLRKIRELVAGGAVVVGPKPLKSPSLADYPKADAEVQSLASELWGDLDGIMRNRHYYKQGQVVWGLPLKDVLASLPLAKDFECSKPLDVEIPWIHRRGGQGDIFFLANRSDQPIDIDARFRVSDKEAEIWHPDSGETEAASYAIDAGRTTVPLQLAPRESVFVVFRRATAEKSREVARTTGSTIATIDGPWDVNFPPSLGAPPKLTLDRLQSWTANSDEGVKYFSGTAGYSKTLDAKADWLKPGARLVLDLGLVRDIAEISLNGKPVATLWKPPYRVDVTKSIQPGENRLEIKVTNQWANRIAGDRVVAAEKRVLAAGGAPGRGGPGGFGGQQALSESGLLGPVAIVSETSR